MPKKIKHPVHVTVRPRISLTEPPTWNSVSVLVRLDMTEDPETIKEFKLCRLFALPTYPRAEDLVELGARDSSGHVLVGRISVIVWRDAGLPMAVISAKFSTDMAYARVGKALRAAGWKTYNPEKH